MSVWSAINTASNAVFSVWFGLFGSLPEWLQIFLTSIPVTVVALLIFRYASNQAGIMTVKDRIKGYLLELWLYKDDLGVMFAAQGQVIRYSLRYMGLALVPMAIMLIPIGLVVVQLESQFAFKGLEPGDSALFTVAVEQDRPVSELDIALNLPESVTMDSPVLRIEQDGQLLWRLRMNADGVHKINLQVEDQSLERRIQVGPGTTPLWPQAYSSDDWRVLGSVAEPPLPAGSLVISTEIEYDRARGEFIGLSSASWLMLLFTLILGFLLRGLFGVTF